MSGHDSDRFYRMQTTPESLYTMVCASSPLSERYGERRCFGSYYLRPIGVEKWLSWWSKPTVFAPGAIVEIQVVLRRFQRPLDALERLQKSNGAHLIENKNRNRFFRLFWALSDRKSMRKMVDFFGSERTEKGAKTLSLPSKVTTRMSRGDSESFGACKRLQSRSGPATKCFVCRIISQVDISIRKSVLLDNFELRAVARAWQKSIQNSLYLLDQFWYHFGAFYKWDPRLLVTLQLLRCYKNHWTRKKEQEVPK